MVTTPTREPTPPEAPGEPDSVLDGALDDETLCALALAADPEAAPAPDAVPLPVYLGQSPGLLPQWYMPQWFPPTSLGPATPRAHRGGRWRLAVVIGLVGVLVALEALGLCSAYGHVVIG